MDSRSERDSLLEFLDMPLETSDPVFEKFSSIPQSIFRGEGLRRFLFVRGTRKDKVLLVAHADTYWDVHYTSSSNPIAKKLTFEKGVIKNLGGGLGADDRAGCAVVWLLRETGHSLLITDGEERGGVGSNWLMSSNPDIAEDINLNHQFVIQFDRRNGRDFKCYSVGTKEFRSYVERITGYTEPDRFSYTDIVTLCRSICGVNLSIGFYREHTEDEFIVYEERLNTLNLCRRWLSESNLPCFPLLKPH